MLKTQNHVKKNLIVGGSLVATAIWLYLELSRYGGTSAYIPSINLMYEWLGLNRRASSVDPVVTVITYCTSGVFSVLIYFLLTLYPRTHSLSDPGTRKKYWCTAGILLACFGIHMLLSRPFLYAALIPKSGVQGRVQNTVYRYIHLTNILLAPVMVLLCIFGAEIPGLIKNKSRILTPRAVSASAARYGLCVVITVVSIICSGALMGIIKTMNPEAYKAVLLGFSGDNRNLPRVISMVILAPLFEEIAFRGMIFGKLRKYIPVWAAFIISSVCFGLWHGNLGQFIYTTMAGFIFCAIYFYTGRLRYAMLAHCLNNIISTISFSLSRDGVLPRIVFFYETREFLADLALIPAILVMAVTGAGVVALLLLLKKVGPVEG